MESGPTRRRCRCGCEWLFVSTWRPVQGSVTTASALASRANRRPFLFPLKGARGGTRRRPGTKLRVRCVSYLGPSCGAFPVRYHLIFPPRLEDAVGGKRRWRAGASRWRWAAIGASRWGWPWMTEQITLSPLRCKSFPIRRFAV